MKNDKKPNPVIAKAQVSPRPARDTERRESLAHRKIDRLERDRERHPHTPTLARQWADPADTAALAAAHQRLVDVCEPAQASPIIRDERTMAEAVAEIRSRNRSRNRRSPNRNRNSHRSLNTNPIPRPTPSPAI